MTMPRRAVRHRVAEHEDAAGDGRDVGGRARDGDHGHRVALLEAARGGVEGDDRGDHAGDHPGRDEAEQRRRSADAAGEGLDGDVGDAEQDARGGAEEHAVVLVLGAELVGEDEQHADGEQAGLEGDHGGRPSSSRASPPVLGSVTTSSTRPRDGEADAGPLADADLEAEGALGQHGEEHEAAGDDGLDERERARARGPRRGRSTRRGRRPCRWRTTSSEKRALPLVSGWRHCDVGSSAGAPVLPEEAKVREEGADKRQRNA